MYSGRQKTLTLPSTQQIALVFGIALFVLILFLAGQAAFRRAQETGPGLAHGITHGADRELGGGGGSSSPNQGLAHRSNGNSAAPIRSYTTPPVVLPAPTSSPFFFVTSGEKQAAQAALVPLHNLMENVRRFDSVVWNATGGVDQSRTAAKGSPSLQLDGLEAQASLVSHPAYYPEPLQDDVAQATREIRIYLETVRVAGVGSQKVGDQAEVQSAAHRHLENGARLLARLDALAGGTAPSSDPGPLPGELP